MSRAQFPFKSNGFKHLNAFLCHVGRFAIPEQFVLTTLTLDPRGELRMGRKIARYIGVSMCHLEALQFTQAFTPGGGLRIPHKANALQRLNALGCHATGLAFLHELVLVALTFDPTCQRQVLRKRVGNQTMSVTAFKGAQFVKHIVPSSGLVRTKAWTAFCVVLIVLVVGGDGIVTFVTGTLLGVQQGCRGRTRGSAIGRRHDGGKRRCSVHHGRWRHCRWHGSRHHHHHHGCWC